MAEAVLSVLGQSGVHVETLSQNKKAGLEVLRTLRLIGNWRSVQANTKAQFEYGQSDWSLGKKRNHKHMLWLQSLEPKK